MSQSFIAQLQAAEALAVTYKAEAALAEGLKTQVAELLVEKESLATSLSEKEALIATLTFDKEALSTEKETLAQHVASLETEKKATEEQALEIVARLGHKAPVEVDVEKSERPSAEAVRAKYMELQSKDPIEASHYFSENRNTILNGYIENR